MTTTLRMHKPAKTVIRTARKNKAKRPVTTASRRESQRLAEYNKWMEANADLVLKVAKKNTLRLTGKEVL